VADTLTPSFALGTVFGRIGCFLNGCCYGIPTTQPWGVTFPADSFAGLEFGNAAVHPSQLYLALSGVALFLIAILLRPRLKTPGVLFWSFMALFALIRIPLDFSRAYEPEATVMSWGALPVVEGQVTSLALMFFSLLMIVRLRRMRRARA
jgi:phosphatidylglycerol:prolipoprotein diacylglycerol transferase